ncbi:MAG: hypothetical protein N2596_01990 [Syntrophorhabdaceae bacterium]|nr:hypothetical protein [Syntrophorhabdaceae bacterium]
MPFYRFKKASGELKEVEAFDLDEALNIAGIDPYEDYELLDADGLEMDEFRRRCLFSAITDDILYGE